MAAARRSLLLICVALVAIAALASVGAAARQSRAATPTTVAVIAGKPSEFKYKLSKTSVKAGTIIFDFSNAGALPHDFKFCERATHNDVANTCTGKGTLTLSPGQRTVMTVHVPTKGTYQYLCTLPGHAAAGMKGLMTVT